MTKRMERPRKIGSGGARNGSGRPRSKTPMKNLNIRIAIAEFEIIAASAYLLKISVSRFVREAALERAKTTDGESEKPR